jgi:pimeloyl-ACP methyl ester carboxylesterase
MAAAQPHARIVDVDGQELVYRQWGAASAQPLVYWPGLTPFSALELIEAGPVWADEYGFRVIAFGGPGLGESLPLTEPDAYRPTRLAALVVRALDGLALDRVAFVGFSWGATIGAHLAAASPQRLAALVLLDAGYSDRQDEADFSERSLAEVEAEARAQQERFRFADWNAFIDTVSTRPNWRPALEDRFRAGMHEVGGEIVARSDAAAAAAALHALDLEPTAALLPALAQAALPILLLASDQAIAQDASAREGLERFRAALPAATVERVEDAGHDLLADAPETIISLVARWLRSQFA